MCQTKQQNTPSSLHLFPHQKKKVPEARTFRRLQTASLRLGKTCSHYLTTLAQRLQGGFQVGGNALCQAGLTESLKKELEENTGTGLGVCVSDGRLPAYLCGPFGSTRKLYKAGRVVCVYNPSTQEKAGKAEVQNHLWLHSEFLASTGYMRSHVMNVCVARECGSMSVCG